MEAAEAAKAAAEGAAVPPVVEEKEEGQSDPAATTENVEEDGVEKTEVCFFKLNLQWQRKLSKILATISVGVLFNLCV